MGKFNKGDRAVIDPNGVFSGLRSYAGQEVTILTAEPPWYEVLLPSGYSSVFGESELATPGETDAVEFYTVVIVNQTTGNEVYRVTGLRPGQIEAIKDDQGWE